MIKYFFKVTLYQPLVNLLILLYQYLPGHDFGVAVIVLTIIIKLILFPLTMKAMRSQQALAGLQPRIQEIQQKIKNKQEQAKSMMALYKKEKINPFGSFFLILIQLPILYILYRVFSNGFQDGTISYLYSFVKKPEVVSQTFLGIVNLAQPSVVLAVITGISQFFQAKLWGFPQTANSKSGDSMARFMALTQKQMIYFFPVVIIFILWKLPSVIGLYWTVSNIFSIFQQYLIHKKIYAKPAKP